MESIRKERVDPPIFRHRNQRVRPFLCVVGLFLLLPSANRRFALLSSFAPSFFIKDDEIFSEKKEKME
jgi:hypothetical protein